MARYDAEEDSKALWHAVVDIAPISLMDRRDVYDCNYAIRQALQAAHEAGAAEMREQATDAAKVALLGSSVVTTARVVRAIREATLTDPGDEADEVKAAGPG